MNKNINQPKGLRDAFTKFNTGKISLEEILDVLKNLTPDDKSQVLINNYLISSLNFNADKETEKDVAVLKLFERLSKISHVVPILSPGFLVVGRKEVPPLKIVKKENGSYVVEGPPRNLKDTVSQLGKFNEATFYRMSNFKGDIFIYLVSSIPLIIGDGREKFIISYVAIDNQDKIKSLNLSGK